ncbi:MAG TPA: phosphoglucosamine mutase [Longimicrobiales bacterium]
MAFEIPNELMVSVSGVRGRVGEALTPEVVARFAAAFGAYVRETAGGRRPRIVLGRDSRTSGPMFVRVATAALQSVGCDVVDVGLVPTPTTLYAIRHHGADGAIVVTASHNPVEWNALKFASAAGMFLDAEEAPRMRAFVADRPVPYVGWDGLGAVVEDREAAARHVDAVLRVPYLDVEGMRRRRFKVALDCIRGAGTEVLPRLLEALGCDVVGLNLEPDGRFPREPEPVAQNLGELERLVRESGADLGLATDPDADRLSLVAGSGRAIGEDFTLALAAALVLRHVTGPVVTNLSTSRLLEDVAAQAGAPFHRTPVGEINVARRMEAEGAVIGGEGNGGVILPDVHLTRDAAVAAALVLQLLLETGRTLDEHVAAQRSYVIIKDKLPRDAGRIEDAYTVLEDRLAAPAADRQDGLRLDWPADSKWLHLRPSGTEPILRIMAEAPTEAEARELVEKARAALLGSEARAAAGADGGPA